mmetsp:Transcript_29527/g.68760  ORF Transcript_29527/g.68760 Transcript_29527/m.68760 type:complete len:289 (-) Transcript_29527:433-1299(-)
MDLRLKLLLVPLPLHREIIPQGLLVLRVLPLQLRQGSNQPPRIAVVSQELEHRPDMPLDPALEKVFTNSQQLVDPRQFQDLLAVLVSLLRRLVGRRHAHRVGDEELERGGEHRDLLGQLGDIGRRINLRETLRAVLDQALHHPRGVFLAPETPPGTLVGLHVFQREEGKVGDLFPVVQDKDTRVLDLRNARCQRLLILRASFEPQQVLHRKRLHQKPPHRLGFRGRAGSRQPLLHHDRDLLAVRARQLLPQHALLSLPPVAAAGRVHPLAVKRRRDAARHPERDALQR